MAQLHTAVETVRAFDPTGHTHIVPVTPAPRPTSIDGLRPGILTNRKTHARLLIETMVDGLRDRASLGELTLESKPSNGPPTRRATDAIVENCDFAIVGTSD